MYFIGIDLGTSSVKVIAMTPSGSIVGVSTADYPITYPKDGWAEQNPEDWWQGTVLAFKSLLEKTAIHPSAIKSIGFSGQMHSLVVLDKNNDVLFPSILWCDQRTQNECYILNNVFGKEKLFNTVSNQALTGFTAPKLMWLKNYFPEIFSNIAHVLLPKDYIRFKLTGNYATDYSDASGMLLLDIKNKIWSTEICDFIDISMQVLPELYESYEVTGVVSEEGKRLLGLEGEVLVVAGAGDQAAGAIGTGTVKEGIISVTLGTSGVVFAAHDHHVKDKHMRLHSFCHANSKYHSMGVMLSAANCLKWWTDKVNIDVPFEQLMLEAEAIPANEQQILFLPYLMGERTPYANPNARGTFIGLTPTTTRGAMTRAILEGVSFGLKDSLDILRLMDVPIEEIRVIGGGSNSNLWLQILASVFDAPVSKINTEHGGALGAAILASVGFGAYDSVESACESIVSTLDTILPLENDSISYGRLHERFKGLYAALAPWF